MKLSVVIAPADAPASAFVVWRGLEESIRKAAQMGYQGVELALKSAEKTDPKVLSELLQKSNLQLSAISTGQVFAVSGLYFTHPDPTVRDQVIDVFKGLIDLAAEFDCAVNVGRVRGFVAEQQSYQQARDLFVQTLARVADMAVTRNVTILIEPVNRYEINFINTVTEGYDLLEEVQLPNVALMPDVFHMNIEDARIGATLAACGARIGYIHLADSNRHAPGQGHLDFDDVFDNLLAAGYDGWAAVEILPGPTPDQTARQAIEFLQPRIYCYNQKLQSSIHRESSHGP